MFTRHVFWGVPSRHACSTHDSTQSIQHLPSDIRSLFIHRPYSIKGISTKRTSPDFIDNPWRYKTRFVKCFAKPPVLPYLLSTLNANEFLTSHACNIALIKKICLRFNAPTPDYIAFPRPFEIHCDTSFENACKMILERLRPHSSHSNARARCGVAQDFLVGIRTRLRFERT